MEDIELQVKKIVAEQLGIKEEDIKNESSFIEDLGADSLTTVEMSLALEDAFGIEIPDTEQENLRTVQQAIDYVKSAVTNSNTNFVFSLCFPFFVISYLPVPFTLPFLNLIA